MDLAESVSSYCGRLQVRFPARFICKDCHKNSVTRKISLTVLMGIRLRETVYVLTDPFSSSVSAKR
jgi:hypothetical protein